ERVALALERVVHRLHARAQLLEGFVRAVPLVLGDELARRLAHAQLVQLPGDLQLVAAHPIGGAQVRVYGQLDKRLVHQSIPPCARSSVVWLPARSHDARGSNPSVIVRSWSCFSAVGLPTRASMPVSRRMFRQPLGSNRFSGACSNVNMPPDSFIRSARKSCSRTHFAAA